VVTGLHERRIEESEPLGPLRPDWRPGVSRLLSTREDLRGIYATADYVDEAIRWSA
jgi:hypothetical protein